MKKLFVISLMVALASCSDGSSKQNPDTKEEYQQYNPSDFVLTQNVDLVSFGETEVTVNLANLATDGAVYLSVTSDELTNNKITVTPYKSILNPNGGVANIKLKIKDQGSIVAPGINVKVTTSGNTSYEQDLVLGWSE
ncbi:hypothetical protein NBRC116188_21650 [Oceaniserpentilla sp. 4NH20-0058]|uniref:hypothetical protein n=1 Tax=Oceaniserpentilla sp. 4NH20-0058 TaxID=3127660 RepID=UPI0031043526